MLNFGIGGLVAGFIGLVLLILSLHIFSNWPAFVKGLITALGVVLCAVVYSSYPTLLGWPANGKILPSRLYLFAIQVEEPHKIFLWGRDLDAGLGDARPRAYEIPYTVKSHESGEIAGAKLKRGIPVIVERRESEGQRLKADNPLQRQPTELVDFIEAPEGLIPTKK